MIEMLGDYFLGYVEAIGHHIEKLVNCESNFIFTRPNSNLEIMIAAT